MNKCNICQKEANATGSHIIPAFILKSLFPRGYERVYTISRQGVRYDIGRNIVDPTITDDALKQNQIPLIEDYLFCKACERNLGYLEDIYSDQIHKKLKSQSPLEIGGKFTSKNTGLIFLFWYSIVWRLSISQHSFKLENVECQSIQEILKLNLRDSIKGLQKHLNNTVGFSLFPLAIAFNGNGEKLGIQGHSLSDVYHIYCNEYIITLYKNPPSPKKNNINYKNSEEFNIFLLSNRDWKKQYELSTQIIVKKILM